MQFGSDNQPGASSRVLEALCAANEGWSHGYGEDPWTARARAELVRVFERDLEVFLVATGTAANALALAAALRPWSSVLCHHQAHILADESTAVELHSGGARVVGISGRDGKLTPAHVAAYFRDVGTDAPHNVRPQALSLSQQSEVGLVYSADEISQLAAAARRFGLTVHMDGARFANAVVASGASPAELTWKAGVDILSLGATKNGCLAAEAIVVFAPQLAEPLHLLRKRGGHLVSKSRIFGAQLAAWLADDHWLSLARHANEQARLLSGELAKVPGVRLAWPTEGNEIFAIVPSALARSLRDDGAEFYDWYRGAVPSQAHLGDDEQLIRLVTSFATQPQHGVELVDSALRASRDLR